MGRRLLGTLQRFTDELEGVGDGDAAGEAGSGGLLTEAKMAAQSAGEVGILSLDPFTSTEPPSRSTTSLLVLRKSSPSNGNPTAALRKGRLN